MLSLAQWKKNQAHLGTPTPLAKPQKLCWTVASVRLVVAGLRTGRTSAGFDEDGCSSTVSLFSAGLDLVARCREEVVVEAVDWAQHWIRV